ncbi:MAG: CDP-alcohol phosphatidyltransferase family protein [Simkaniaceae bacterium]
MTIALILTISRVVISPIFILFYLYYDKMGLNMVGMSLVLISLLALSEVTDFLDGFFARRYNEVTELGKVLDPMCDSIARLSILLGFTQGIVQLPLLLVLVFFYRDSVISTLRTLCALRGVALAARISGKVKAVIQGASAFVIIIAIFFYSLDFLSLKEMRLISFYMISVTAAYTLFSGVEYLMANRHFIKKAWVSAPQSKF